MTKKNEYFCSLTIGGSDNCGGAGIQADLKTFSALGCYGMSAITALTAQNTQGVQSIQEIPPKFLAAQITSILEDIRVDAVKIGMLFNISTVMEVSRCLNQSMISKIVLDPVMFAKSGDRLLQEDAIQSIKQELFPLATIATPNILEAEALLDRTINSQEEIQAAGLELCALGPEAVVVKGGNLPGSNSDDCLVYKNGKIKWLKQRRINTSNVHGTGCTFSSAITAFLAQSYSLEESVSLAKKYLTEALEAGKNTTLGKGKGPVMHFYKFWLT